MLSPGTNPPYHILYPFIALKVHGKLKGIAIFSEQWWGRQVSKLYYPTQARTLAQQMGRWTFYNASYNWKHFDQPTKNYYNALVKGKPTYGYGRFVQLFFKANYPMIIYWNTLEKSASDPALIPDYIDSIYFRGSCYPAAVNKFLSLGPSGDLVLPADFSAKVKAKARAYRNAALINLTANTWTKIPLDVENYDLGGNFDLVNSKFIAPVAGYYLVTGCVGFASITQDLRVSSAIYKDGAIAAASGASGASDGYTRAPISDILYLTATQYVELYANITSISTGDINVGSQNTWMAVHLLSV